MADLSEDLIGSAAQIDDHDPEEEIQDFRFLLSAAQSQKLPSRGMKDFEPHGTSLQQSVLDTSREAMHLALSHVRTHTSDKSRAVYDGAGHGAWVFRPSGIWSKSTGKDMPVPGRIVEVKTANGDVKQEKLRRMWLLPEEVLWLTERGSLDLRYRSDVGREEDDGLPMSLQAAYAKFITTDTGLSLEEFNVYQYLKRCGYIVLRAKQNMHNVPNNAQTLAIADTPMAHSFSSYWHWLLPQDKHGQYANKGPLVKPGLYRDYTSIYNQLSLIPFHDPRHPPQATAHSHPNVTWHVYKSIPNFKKSAPGPPDFYVSVISARDDCVLLLPDLDALLAQVPSPVPDSKAGLNQRLKAGWRNVILAVVDQGVISYVDISESGFGCEKVWATQKGRITAGKSGRPRKGKSQTVAVA